MDMGHRVHDEVDRTAGAGEKDRLSERTPRASSDPTTQPPRPGPPSAGARSPGTSY